MFSLPIQNLVAMFLVLQPRYPSKVILQQKSAFATLVLYEVIKDARTSVLLY